MKSRPLPLSGIRVLVGRARHQVSKLSAGLRELGGQVIEIPFIEIRKPGSYKPLDSALRKIQNYDWLILTSVNGVDALWGRVGRLGLSLRDMRHLRIAAIGPATKQAIEGRGLKVTIVPKEYVAESVVKSLRARVKGKCVLLARAKVARDVIPRELRQLGAEVDVAEAYETVVPKTSGRQLRSVLENSTRRPDVITFTSSSSVRNFVSLLSVGENPHPFAKNAKGWGTLRNNRRATLVDGIQFASIGPVTSSTLHEFGLPVHIEAREYTIPGLIRAIEQSLVVRR